jgi:hypothetical protein
MKTVFFLALFLACSTVGCTVSMTGGLRTQAAFDLNCPAERLAISNLSGPRIVVNSPDTTVQAVVGCGKRASYVYDGIKGWLKNSSEPAR